MLKATDAGYFATMQKAGSAVEGLTQKAGAGSNISGSRRESRQGMTIRRGSNHCNRGVSSKALETRGLTNKRSLSVAGGTSGHTKVWQM